MAHHRRSTLADFRVLKKLGSGSFGSCYLAERVAGVVRTAKQKLKEKRWLSGLSGPSVPHSQTSGETPALSAAGVPW